MAPSSFDSRLAISGEYSGSTTWTRSAASLGGSSKPCRRGGRFWSASRSGSAYANWPSSRKRQESSAASSSSLSSSGGRKERSERSVQSSSPVNSSRSDESGTPSACSSARSE